MTQPPRTSGKAKKVLFACLRYMLAVGCLVYALWGVDFRMLGEIFMGFSPLAVAGLVFLSFAGLAPAAARLRFLSGGRMGLGASASAVLIALALNNVLPAKAGEFAKIVFLRNVGGIPAGESLEIVFWERFSDLNALLVLGAASLFFIGQMVALYPLALFVLAVWVFILLDRRLPAASLFLIGLIPWPRLSGVLRDTLSILRTRSTISFYGVYFLITALAWSVYAAVLWLCITRGAGLDITFGQSLIVLTVSLLGYAIPSSPGAIGLYEAAFVVSLGWFGVPKEPAFAAGLLCHALQLVPSTLVGLVLVTRHGGRMRLGEETASA